MEPIQESVPGFNNVTPELLANLEREIVPWGRSFVDDRNAKQLANQVFRKAIVLEVTTIGEDEAMRTWESQASFIRKERLAPAPEKTKDDDEMR
jgi:hypothetical protein